MIMSCYGASVALLLTYRVCAQAPGCPRVQREEQLEAILFPFGQAGPTRLCVSVLFRQVRCRRRPHPADLASAMLDDVRVACFAVQVVYTPTTEWGLQGDEGQDRREVFFRGRTVELLDCILYNEQVSFFRFKINRFHSLLYLVQKKNQYIYQL